MNCHNPLFFQAGLKVTCSMEGGRAWGSSYSMTNLASVLYTMSCTYTVYTCLWELHVAAIYEVRGSAFSLLTLTP